MYLENIKSPADVKKLAEGELPELAAECRAALVIKLSRRGGHLASNLGAVELVVALEYVFDSPRDRLVFDVSHQSYVHKMLTGRAEAFLDESRYGDVTGFTNPAESEHDLFCVGHTSTSIGLACGLAAARDASGGDWDVVAVIGDSSLDGGQAFEGLNLAGDLGGRLIVVVNDNAMSIPENHGALAARLAELRETGGAAEDNYFRSLGFSYRYVGEGHDPAAIARALSEARRESGPTVVHVHTVKGKGYAPAEADPEAYHWVSPFDVETGRMVGGPPKENYGAIAREHLLAKMAADPKVRVVAASTPKCIGFTAEARARAGSGHVDVGIAEQNALLFAAGLAKGGLKPVFATDSTFFQRAYDIIEQEVCVNQLPVTMVVTHGSVYGHGNNTHAGLYDVALLGNIPGLTYLAPANRQEYLAMLDWALDKAGKPVAIRVPWTGVTDAAGLVDADYDRVTYKVEREGSDVALLALGGFFGLGGLVADALEAHHGIRPTLVNPRVITGVDANALEALRDGHRLVVTLEDAVVSGGFGSRVAQYYGPSTMRVLCRGFSMGTPVVFKPAEIVERDRMTVDALVEDIVAALNLIGEGLC